MYGREHQPGRVTNQVGKSEIVPALYADGYESVPTQGNAMAIRQAASARCCSKISRKTGQAR
jgi:hypothetical protein